MNDLNTTATQSEARLAELVGVRDAPTGELIAINQDGLKVTWEKLAECRAYMGTADAEIAALERVLTGWKNYRAYQSRREPFLLRRYMALRDFVRSAEDERTDA